jgi:Mg-chelatase subunit ChlD
MKYLLIPLLLLTTITFAQDRPLGPPKPEQTEAEKKAEKDAKEKAEAEAKKKADEKRKREEEAAKKLSHTTIKRQCSQMQIDPFKPSMSIGPFETKRHHPDITNITLPREMPRMIAQPHERTTRHVIYLVDVSGSMKDEKKLRRAIQASMMLLTYAVETFEAKIYAFNNKFAIWPGFKDPNPPPGAKPPLPGWTMFPSADAMNAAIHWIAGVGAKGSTDPSQAMLDALMTKRKKLTIIVISDGEFNADNIKNAIAQGQGWRKKELGEKAIIGAFGVGTFIFGKDEDGDEDNDLANLRYLGQVGKGGAWVEGDAPKNAPR